MFRRFVRFLPRHGGTGDIPSRRVADQSSHIPNQKNNIVAQILKVFQLTNQDRVSEVQVWRGGVKARLHTQRTSLFGRLRSRSRKSSSRMSSARPFFK